MGVDADTISLDRGRQVLLTDIVTHTEQLSSLMRDLDTHDEQRLTGLDGFLAAQQTVDDLTRTGSVELDTARDRHDEAVATLKQAESGKQRAQIRQLLGEQQRDRVDLDAAKARLQAEQDRKSEAERTVQVNRVAGIVARRNAVKQQQIELQRMLAELEARSEPMRQAAAAAVSAWQYQIAADLRETQHKASDVEAAYQAAEQQGRKADLTVAAVQKAIGAAESRGHAIAEQLQRIGAQRGAAVQNGDLQADQEPAEALAAVTAACDELERSARQVGDELHALSQQIDDADSETRTHTSRLSTARTEAEMAASTLSQLTEQTTGLAGEVASSGLIDLDPVRLDDHAEMIAATLKAIADRTHGEQLRAFERFAGAQRAVHSLEHRGLLPARPDVEDLCAQMLARGWGARAGWDYLATLEPGVAQRYAAAHPGLADGIVVTDPDDTDPILAHLNAHREVLTSPIVVGAPDAFRDADDQADPAQVAVVLPHEAVWSATAGEQQLPAKTDELARHEQDEREHRRVYDQAVRLGDLVARWRLAIGADRLRTTEQAVRDADEFAEQCERDLDAAAERLVELRRRRQALSAQAEHISQQRFAAEAHRGRVDALTQAVSGEAELVRDAEQVTAELAKARRTWELATTDAESARTLQAELRAEKSHLDKQEGRLRHEQAEADALADTVVQPADRVEATKSRTNRAILAAQTRAATDRWKGALSDGQLTAQIAKNTDELREILVKLGDENDDVKTAAEQLVQENSTRSSADFDTYTERSRTLVARISGEVGRWEAAVDASSRRYTDTSERYNKQPLRDQLIGDDHTSDAAQAAIILDRLVRKVREATERVIDASRAERDTARAVARLDGRQQQFANAAAALDGKVSMLATGQQLTDTIDLEDRRFALNAAALAQAPAAIHALLETLNAASDSDQSRTAVNERLATLGALVDTIGKRVREAHGRASERLNRLARCLDLATDELVSKERVLQMLRRERGTALARKAVQHHHDLIGRRDSVTHHVAKFDERVQKLADITYGNVELLRRAVVATERDSILPDTPAMGRWAGLRLLKLSGLDTLTVEDRKAAIRATLHRWFDPDLRGQRRRFDTEETVFDLLAAVCPRFTAKFLIPSDPLVAEHLPVEQVAKRTSGGEGVTVALILAALLAARRGTAHGYRRTTLLLDNPFAKLTKPAFWRLALDVATSLNVSLVALSGIKDTAALTVFPTFVKLRVSRRSNANFNANFVVPFGITDERLQALIRDGALFVSATEWALAGQEDDGSAWPVISSARVAFDQQLTFDMPTNPAAHQHAEDEKEEE
jgi:hypothetical protein